MRTKIEPEDILSIKKLMEKNIESQYFDTMKSTMDVLRKDLYQQFDNIVIEALKRKGFEFKSNAEIVNFIRERCKCYHRIEKNQKIYVVDDIPFLLFNEEIDVITDPRVTENNNVITASLGTYQFL